MTMQYHVYKPSYRNGYRHVSIGVWTSAWSNVASFSWQGNGESGEWYGCTMEICSSKPDDFEFVTKLVKGVCKKSECGTLFSVTPQQVLAYLSKKGDEVFFHDSFSERLPLKEWPKLPSFRLYQGKSFLHRIFATTQKLAEAQAAAFMVEHGYDVKGEWRVQFEAEPQPLPERPAI